MDSSNINDTCRGHVCGIVPPSLLKHLSTAGRTDKVRNAALLTLAHSDHFRAHRGQAHLHGGGYRGIVPPGIFQAVLDSPHASDNEKRLAQKHLDTSAALRAARGGGTGAVPPATATATSTKGLFRILYNANKHSRLPGREVWEEGETISTTVQNDRDFQRVSDGFKATYELFKESFGRNSIDDQGMDLVGTVHFDDDDRPPGFDNAMWDSRLNQMIFGDGDGEVFGSFTSSIDVIGHELTHGVTDFTAELPYEFMSGALNESLSDVFGSMVKQKFKGQSAEDADWLIGEGLFIDTEKNPALRSMKEPGTAFSDVEGSKDDQPGHMRDYVRTSSDEGGVHTNSGIPNHAFYFAATAMGGNSWETAGPIWYKALVDGRLKDFAHEHDKETLRDNLENGMFKFFAELTVEHAGSDADAAKAVKEAWGKVGVL